MFSNIICKYFSNIICKYFNIHKDNIFRELHVVADDKNSTDLKIWICQNLNYQNADDDESLGGGGGMGIVPPVCLIVSFMYLSINKLYSNFPTADCPNYG